MAESKHVEHFRKAHLRSGEEVVAWANGYAEKKPGIKRGSLLVTTKRVVCCHQGWFGEHVEHFDLAKVTSVERSSNMFQHKAVISAGSADLRFQFAADADAEKRVHEALDAGRQNAA